MAIKSITIKLLSVIFSFYVVIALTLTIVHIVADYQDKKSRIIDDLADFQETFSAGITLALWELDHNQLEFLIEGALKIPAITGVKVVDKKGDILFAAGTFLADSSRLESHQLFWRKAPLIYSGSDVPVKVALGEITFYSSESVVFERVKLDIIIIVVNALIKTIALWVIFIFVTRKFLSRPLQQLTQATAKLDYDQLKHKKIIIKTQGRYELALLSDTFNELIAHLHQSILKQESAEIEKLKAEQDRVSAQSQVIETIKEAHRIKSEFLAAVSHELRTPLNGIDGSLQLLERADNSEEDKAEYLHSAKASTEYMTMMIEDILTFVEMQSGSLTVQKGHFSLSALLAFVKKDFEGKVAAKHLTLTTQRKGLPGDYVRADKLKIDKLLHLLLQNAVKYTEKGRIDLTFNLRLSEDGQSRVLELIVSDTGIGISTRQQSAIFDAFSQLDAGFTRQQGGLGIGLSISNQIVKLLNGSLHVESTLGVGSSFRGCLPVEMVEADGRFNTNIADDELLKRTPNSDLKVLVVEDNPVSQKVITAMLNKLCYQVVTANNGAEAVDFFTELPIDIVLMDCQMPVMDGYQATKLIRAMNKGKTIPIVAITANMMDKDRERCFEVGMNDCLKKPVKLQVLECALDHWLGHKNQTN